MKLIAVLKPILINGRVVVPKTIIDKDHPFYDGAIKQYPTNNRYGAHNDEEIKECHAVILVDVTEDNENQVRKELVSFMDSYVKDFAKRKRGATRFSVKNDRDAEIQKVIQNVEVKTVISTKDTVVNKEIIVEEAKEEVKEEVKIPATRRTKIKESNPNI